MQIVEQRSRFDSDPQGFCQTQQSRQQDLQERIGQARGRLAQVQLDAELRLAVSQVCGELDVDGLRGDIVSNRAARALAALAGRDQVEEEDVARVVCCCLRHRLRKDPMETVDSGARVIKAFCKVFQRAEPETSEPFQLSLT